MSSKLITAPTLAPVTLDEAKAQLRVAGANEDVYITRLIAAASSLFEEKTGRALMEQTWELTLDKFPCAIQLKRPPITSVVSIKYTDITQSEQALETDDYFVDISSDTGAQIVPAINKAWPADVSTQINSVRVRYLTGYKTEEQVPEVIRQWLIINISNWYATRESIVVGSIIGKMDIDHMIDTYRIIHL